MAEHDEHDDLEELSGGMRTAVFRNGEVVLRPVAPWTATIHALLQHLERVGYEGSPRVSGTGYDDKGHETLVYIEGEPVHPYAWSNEGVHRVGALLRGLHDATSTFEVPRDAVWQPWFFRSAAPDAIVGHGDSAPWNIIASEGMPLAFIDWESAGPIDRWDDITQAAWLNCQLHDDDVAEMQRLPSVKERARQLGLFLDGYRLAKSERTGFITRMIEYAIRDCAKEAIEPAITPDSTDPAPLWALAWRARSAAWMVRNREVLENAILANPE